MKKRLPTGYLNERVIRLKGLYKNGVVPFYDVHHGQPLSLTAITEVVSGTLCDVGTCEWCDWIRNSIELSGGLDGTQG